LAFQILRLRLQDSLALSLDGEAKDVLSADDDQFSDLAKADVRILCQLAIRKLAYLVLLGRIGSNKQEQGGKDRVEDLETLCEFCAVESGVSGSELRARYAL
jgi:hypothetical protein